MSTNFPFILTAIFLLYITDYENQDLSKTQIFEEQILFMKQGFLFLIHSSISLPMSPRCTSELTLDIKSQSETGTTVPGGMWRSATTQSEIKKPSELHFNITQPYHAVNSHQGKPSVALWSFWEARVVRHAVG